MRTSNDNPGRLANDRDIQFHLSRYPVLQVVASKRTTCAAWVLYLSTPLHRVCGSWRDVGRLRANRPRRAGGTETDYDRLHVIKATCHSESIKCRSPLVRWLSLLLNSQPAPINFSRVLFFFAVSFAPLEYTCRLLYQEIFALLMQRKYITREGEVV